MEYVTVQAQTLDPVQTKDWLYTTAAVFGVMWALTRSDMLLGAALAMAGSGFAISQPCACPISSVPAWVSD